MATQAVHSLNYELAGEAARRASDGVKHPVMARIAAKLEGESDVRLAREGESDYVIHLRVATAADIVARVESNLLSLHESDEEDTETEITDVLTSLRSKQTEGTLESAQEKEND